MCRRLFTFLIVFCVPLLSYFISNGQIYVTTYEINNKYHVDFTYKVKHLPCSKCNGTHLYKYQISI